MAHLHKLEKWRNPATKRRAVIAPVYGTHLSVSVLFFEYRRKYSCDDAMFSCASDARDALARAGFERATR